MGVSIQVILVVAMVSLVMDIVPTASASGSNAATHDDPSTTYNFLAIADWGNDDVGQHAAAAGLGVVAAQINATQVFVLGDNFYTTGIHPGPIDGPGGEVRFKKTFEVR
jgi:hypothetical protein